MNQAESQAHSTTFLSTKRTDLWWLEPLGAGLGFLCFVIYTTWAMFQANHYYAYPYLSPLYSPTLMIDPTAPGAAPLSHAWFGAWPGWWPKFLPPSPAMLVLLGPLSFRLTCYYYRKFYYRSYFLTPPACAVTAFPQKDYKGETHLLLFQNIHRYCLYIALGYILILTVDVYKACFKDGLFGIGVGTVILYINVLLLSKYTFGCHAFRHLMGGRMDCFSCPNGKEHKGYGIWKQITKLNENHMFWAWVSMIWVGFSDFYVRMVSMGVWHDINTWGH